MVKDLQVRKGLSLPPLHPCRRLCVPILSAIFEHGIASNGLIARPPHKLSCMSYGVLSIHLTISERSVYIFAHESAGNAEGWSLLEPPDQGLEIFRCHRDVSVQISNELILNADK